MKTKLTKNDIDKVFPPKQRSEAIEQSERYEQEYEVSKKRLDDILEKLDEMLKELEKLEKKKKDN